MTLGVLFIFLAVFFTGIVILLGLVAMLAPEHDVEFEEYIDDAHD